MRYCEVHRRPYYSNETHNCCKEMFNEKPFFTNLGTCYTTNAVVLERFPFSLAVYKIPIMGFGGYRRVSEGIENDDQLCAFTALKWVSEIDRI